MKVIHRLSVIIGGVAIVAATGGIAAYAASQSHDPNVVGGRFCVDFGTNTAHYDWNNLPCAPNQYVDQNTYSIPADNDVVVPVLTRYQHYVDASNPQTVTANIPSGAMLNEVLAVTDETKNVSVPFTFVVNNPATGSVTITYVGTPAETPAVQDTVVFTYGYTPQG